MKMLMKPYILLGRAWKPKELRLKSLSDLHKLWFVLLKERNKLLTEKAHVEVGKQMLNPARINKVFYRINSIVSANKSEYIYLLGARIYERNKNSNWRENETQKSRKQTEPYPRSKRITSTTNRNK